MKLLFLWCLLSILILSASMVKNDQATHSEQSPPQACGPHGVCKCGKAIKFYQVNCKNRSYQVVPKDILSNATKIVLSDNSLEYIPYDVFKYTTEVNTIDLTNNSLTEIPPELFATTVHLETLLIFSNKLTKLPAGMLANTPNLILINLYGNELSTLPDDLFENKPNLTIVILWKNKLHKLSPRMFSSAPSVTTLFLGTNKISEIPVDFFRAIPKLCYLSMPKNNIKNLTQSSFAGLTSMSYMSFAWNDLSVLQADVFGGVNLRGSIDLSHNNITEIPDGLFSSNDRIHDLKELYLQGNNLTFLRSHSFKGLHRLNYIFLNNNNISTLESDVFSNTPVQYIYMFGNALESITDNVFGNEHIKEIHLYENEIQSISETTLTGMNNNIKLYLNCNKLNQIPWSSHFTKMSCVHSHFVPIISFENRKNTKLRMTLQKEGFICTTTGPKSKPGNVSCQPCPPGKYGNGHGNCVPCHKGGFYQDKIGNRRCKECHEGTFVNASIASSLDQCRLCPEGTDQTQFANYRACFCKTSYSRNHRFMGCSFCFEEGINCSSDYKFLLRGYYWNWSFPQTNMSEYADFVANLQTKSWTYDNSTIQYKRLMPYVHKCPNSESCLNSESHTVEGLQGTCSGGYRGWLCYQCQSGYYRVLSTCKPCPTQWLAILESIAVVLLLCGVLYFLIWQGKDKKGKKMEKEERSLADKVSSRMKIVLGFYQVVGELFESLHDINWVGPLSVVGNFLSFRSINIFELFIRPRCLNDNFVIDSKLEFKIALMFPVFALTTALLAYHIWKLVLLSKIRQDSFTMQFHLNKLKSKVYSYILLLLFVTYTPTCDAIFAFFPEACKSFNMYQNNTETIKLLRSDYDLRCDQSLKAYHIWAHVATIYVITFPCTLLFVLRRYWKSRDIKADIQSIQREPAACHERTHLLSRADRMPVPFWMKFLCENYKPRFWYWEIIELARKLTQTALVTLRGWDDALTILSTIGLSVIFLTLHAKYAPMKIPFEQRLQMFSLSAIFINILVVAVKIPPHYEEVISTILILLNLIILLIIAGEIAVGLFRYVRKKCSCNYNSNLEAVIVFEVDCSQRVMKTLD